MANFLKYGEQKQTHPQTHFQNFVRRDIVRIKPNFCEVFGGNESAQFISARRRWIPDRRDGAEHYPVALQSFAAVRL